MSEPIITPEVLAALERRKLFRYMLNQQSMRHAEVINHVYSGSIGRPALEAEMIADAVPALLAELDRLRAAVSRLTNANAHFLRRRPE